MLVVHGSIFSAVNSLVRGGYSGHFSYRPELPLPISIVDVWVGNKWDPEEPAYRLVGAFPDWIVSGGVPRVPLSSDIHTIYGYDRMTGGFDRLLVSNASIDISLLERLQPLWMRQEDVVEKVFSAGFIYRGGDAAEGNHSLRNFGFDGPDRIHLEGGNDHWHGAGGADRLFGGDGDDVLFGGHGNDRLFGGSGDDTLEGGAGADRLFGDAGDDVLRGDVGRDRLFGGGGADTLEGGAGADRLFGGAARDLLFGGDGNDRLVGGAGGDRLEGGLGDDRLLGDGGTDRMFGGHGDDVLFGGHGDDILHGGPGRDTLHGGPGADLFVFRPGTGFDMVADLRAGDRLDFRGFGGLDTPARVLGAIRDTAFGARFEHEGDAVLLRGIKLADLTPEFFDV